MAMDIRGCSLVVAARRLSIGRSSANKPSPNLAWLLAFLVSTPHLFSLHRPTPTRYRRKHCSHCRASADVLSSSYCLVAGRRHPLIIIISTSAKPKAQKVNSPL